jgi:hypothetical protein
MIYGRQGVILDANGRSPNFPGAFGVRIVPRSILPIAGGVWPGLAGDVRVPFYLQPLQDAGGEVDSGIGTAQPVPIVETDFRWRGRNKLNGWRIDGPPSGTFDAWWTTDPDDEWGSPGLVRVPIVLYDVTSAPNTALDTLAIGAADFDGLYAYADGGGGTIQLTGFEVADDGGSRQLDVPPGAATSQSLAWHPGALLATGVAASGAVIGYIVPRRVRFTASAAGVGFSSRIRVLGLRR